jgi:hypothetical protein
VVGVEQITVTAASRNVSAAAVAGVGACGAVALYVWDDVLWAAPIGAAVHLTGALAAFAVFAALYGAGSYAIAMWGVRAYERRGVGPSRLADWVARARDARRGRWGERLLRTGRTAGFLVSSVALGGILTTWLLRYAGVEEGIARLAAASSAVFGLTFAGFYAGLFGLIT